MTDRDNRIVCTARVLMEVGCMVNGKLFFNAFLLVLLLEGNGGGSGVSNITRYPEGHCVYLCGDRYPSPNRSEIVGLQRFTRSPWAGSALMPSALDFLS